MMSLQGAYQEKDSEAGPWEKSHLGISLLASGHSFLIYKWLVGLDSVFSPSNSDIYISKFLDNFLYASVNMHSWLWILPTKFPKTILVKKKYLKIKQPRCLHKTGLHTGALCAAKPCRKMWNTLLGTYNSVSVISRDRGESDNNRTHMSR